MTIKLPKIGLGTFKLKPPICKEMVLKGIDIGYRMIDTAQFYKNEQAVGEAIKEHTIDRKDLMIGTKVWGSNLTYDLVISSTEESLAKLRTDYIDILYVHWPNDKYEPKETFRGFDKLVDDGKIKHIAISNFTQDLIDQALPHLKHPIFINQLEHHPLLQLKKERTYLETKNIKLVAYSPVAQGQVRGVPELVEIAKKHNSNEFSISIAWLMSHGAIPIPKGSTLEHLQSNFDAQNLKLDEEDIEKIDNIQFEKRLVNYWPFV